MGHTIINHHEPPADEGDGLVEGVRICHWMENEDQDEPEDAHDLPRPASVKCARDPRGGGRIGYIP